MEAAGEKIKGIGSSIEGVGHALTPISTAAAAGLAGSAKAAIDFESAMTGVKKTVDATETEYEQLSDWIKEASTRMASSKTDIAGVMEVAGQLGVKGIDNLEEFTETMVMLGDTTNLSSEQAASALAKFMNITGTSLQDSGKLGSSIVDLGNNFATTESDIVEMSTRLASAGTIAGLSATDILALSTAMSSVGIQAEAGGTAMSQTLKAIATSVESLGEPSKQLEKATVKNTKAARALANAQDNAKKKLIDYNNAVAKHGEGSAQAQKALISLETAQRKVEEATTDAALAQETLNAYSENSGTSLETFARVAGMSADEFAKTWKSSPIEALQAFITGLGNLNEEEESTISLLEELGLDGIRQSNMLQALSLSAGMMGDAVSTSNTAFGENNALMEEAEKRYGTTASKMEQTKEKLTNIGIEIGERLLPYLDKGLDVIDQLITAWDGLSEEEQNQIVQAALLTAAAAPVITTTGKVIQGVGSIASVTGGAVKGLGELSGIFGPVAGGATSVAGATGSASASIAGIAGPAAIAVGAVALLGGAFVTAYQNDEEFAKKVDEDWAEIKSTIQETIDIIKPEWEAFSEFMTPVFTAAMESIDRRLEQFKTNFQGWADIIHGILEGDWSRAWEGAKKVVFSANDAMQENSRTNKEAIEGIFSKLNIELPHIKLPHFKVTGTNSFGLPSFDIDWYAKAMDGGMRLTSPTVFGATSSGLLAGGEAGSEWVIGENSILGMIRSAVHSSVGYIPETGNQVSIGDTNIQIVVEGNGDPEEIAEKVDEIISMRYEQARAAWA